MSQAAAKDYAYYAELKDKIKQYNHAYYDEDAPLISDYKYDSLLRELEELEKEHPEWQSEDSPTLNVGGTVNETFSKVEHEVKMESLQDLFSLAEIRDFINKTNKALNKELEYVVEEKIDGLSVALEYRNGVFYRGSTRGDGTIGENVSKNLLNISNVPKTLKVDKPERLVVRAEVYMPKASFASLNEEQEAQGNTKFANPRNAAAGSLRQLDPQVTAKRNLDLFCFNLQLVEGMDFKTHYETLEFFKRNGFPVIHAFEPSSDIEQIEANIKAISARRADLSYGIDGAVIKVNNLDYRTQLGSTSKYPRWAAAFKYTPEQQKTKVLDIKVNVGRTGKLTPLAVLEPVLVDGSMISRVSLHNEDYVKEKDVRVNDTVVIHKAGDVIPELVEVDLSQRDADSEKFTMPEDCPVCGAKVVRSEDEAATYCTNANCPAQVERRIEHFASRSAMDITGLGEKNVKFFYQKGYIRNIADIYRLKDKRESLIEEPGFGEKSVDKLLASIEASKANSLEDLINGLGIQFIGANASRLLAENVPNMETLSKLSQEDIQKIDGLGTVSAKSVYTFFQDEDNLNLLRDLKDLGLNFESNIYKEDKEDLAWSDLKFVLTGSLDKYTRSEASTLIENNGGKVQSSVSKNVDYLLLGENPGSKYDKAKELGINILSEADFEKALEDPEKLIN